MTTKPRGKELTFRGLEPHCYCTATRNKSGRGELPREIIRFGTAIFPALPKVITNTVLSTMDCFEAPRMGLNLIFIKVSAAPTGALGPWKVEEP